MANNWSVIGSGATFHALVGTLLLYEDRTCRVFNREGADGAIDAISGDRKIVYQAKHHKNGGAGRAIADALGELKKIQKYRQSSHKWEPLWRDVETWRLFTDVPFGSSDGERWDKEVVPEFRKENLTAEYVSQAELDLKLAAHPDVADAFFGRRTRMFISLAEQREKLLSREVLQRSYDVPLQGRAAELAAISDFARDDSQQVMLVHGAGGLGKSRLLWEAASQLLDDEVVETVYCGTSNLEAGSDWYVGIVPEAKALVLLDEPQNPAFIARLLDELRGRTKEWKVLVGVRTANDPVVRPLIDPRERLVASPIELKPLARTHASSYAKALLEPLKLSPDDAKRAEHLLVDVCGQFPIWMTVATHLIEQSADLRDLAADTKGIARVYVDEVLKHTPPEISTATQARDLLRWIALVQPLNRQDPDTLAYVASAAGYRDSASADRAIEDLSRRRAVSCFGVEKRMVEVRPDVFRDYLLVDWLTYPRTDGGRQASSEAQQLADRLSKSALAGEEERLHRRVVTSLGRMEFLLEPRVAFLDAIADAAVSAAADAPNTLKQERVLEFAKPLAYLRPRQFAQIARFVRTSTVEEGVDARFFYPRPVLRDDSVDSLPPLLFDAARGATEGADKGDVLEEMMACVEDQAGRGIDARGGQAAAELLPRMVQEHHGFRSELASVAAPKVAAALDGLASGSDVTASATLLIKALLQIERHESYVTPDEMLQQETRRLLSSGPSGRIVVAIRERLWALTSGQEAGRRTAWKLLEYAHGQLRQFSTDPGWKGLLLDDLRRCLQAVSSQLTLESLQAARPIWAWHAAHDRDDETRRLALECQAAYLRHPIVRDYAPVFGAEVFDIQQDRFRDVIDGMPTPLSESAIDTFFEGARRFTETHSEGWRRDRLVDFGRHLASLRGNEPGFRTFMEKGLRFGLADTLFDVAITAAVTRIHGLRLANDLASAGAERDALYALLPDDQSRAQFLSALYSLGARGGPGFDLDDLNFLEHQQAAYAVRPSWWRFGVLGRFLPAGEAALKKARDELQLLPMDQQGDAVARLWSGYFHSLPFDFEAKDISPKITDFLLEMTALLEDPRRIHGQSEWEMGQIVGHVPRKPISWLVEIGRRRQQRFSEENRRRSDEHVPAQIRALPTDHSILLNIVAAVPDAPLSAEDEKALDALCTLGSESYLDEYVLPELLVDLDPHGRYVPRRVARSIEDPLRIATALQLAQEVRYAGWYPIGSGPWREIALGACRRLDSLGPSDRDRSAVYSSLSRHGVESWGGGHPDEIHPRWQQAIDEAAASLNAESEPSLRAYWAWRVKCAEAQLHQEQGAFEERRSRN